MLLAFACTSTKPHFHRDYQAQPSKVENTEEALQYQLILLGGLAEAPLSDSPLPAFLQQELAKAGKNSGVIILGNIEDARIYQDGFSKKTYSDLSAVGKIFLPYNGEIIFMPGYKDYGSGAKKGHILLKNQKIKIEEKFQEENIKLPCHECPGPKAIKLKKGIYVIAIDTQWWLEKKKDSRGCSITNEEDFLIELKRLLEEHDDDQVIIAGYHGLKSAGPHGGYFPARYHFFPLTQLNKNLLLPLPGIGSFYPFYRSAIGNEQDQPNVRHAYMIERIKKIIDLYPNIIYAAGNEQSLQYFNDKKRHNHYIISGAASRAEYVSKNAGAAFAQSATGYFKINFYKNKAVRLEAWSFPKNNTTAKIVFQKELIPPLRDDYQLPPTLVPRDSLVAVADPQYDRDDFLSNSLIGKNYRKEWLTPLKVPVVDFAKEQFTPVKLGGGVQTSSLRVKRPDGTQYVLRSVQKDVTKKLPRFLQKTFVRRWMQDAITATHPYSALIIPDLAAAAQINYAIPQLGYVPASPQLGRFNEAFAGTLVIWEGRPRGDMSAFKNFGSAKKIKSTPDVLQKTRKSLKNKVDEKSMIRNRLFDIFINDIDRHDDQWRWAVYKQKNGGETYRPIPRDRDFAFTRGDGILLKIAGYKWAFRQAQSFDEDIRDVAGVALQGKYVDRTFITESSRAEWQAIAEDLQKKLTDESIEKAVKKWPGPIYNIHGEKIISLMKTRRKKLPEWAARLYAVYAEQVDVLGSDKKDLFEINRMNDTITNVKIFGLGKKGEKKDLYYDRSFYTDETKEISLYGFKEDDVFEFTGKTNKGILIRAIGGNGNDIFNDQSAVKKGRKKTWIYDNKKNTVIIKSPETKDLTSAKCDVNFYDRFAHKYPKPLPLVVLGFNRDDIVFIGGGYSIRHYGFRKKPYAHKHAAKIYYSLSNAFAFSYFGDYRKIIGPVHLDVNSHFLGPNYRSQFFGVGNDTEIINAENRDFHSADYDEFWLAPNFYFDSKYQHHKIQAGPLFQHIDMREEGNNNFVNTPAAGIPSSTFSSTNYIGAQVGYRFKSVDAETAPNRGIKWNNKIIYQKSLDNRGFSFLRFSSDLSMYVPIKKIKAVVASRTGFSSLTGDYAFYHNNFIGGQRTLLSDVTLSGYQRNRFAGKSAFYQNIEYRSELFQDVKIVLPFDIGLVANYDLGRVWEADENSSTLHSGYGIGFTGKISSFSVFMLNYTWSKEDQLFLFSTKVRY